MILRNKIKKFQIGGGLESTGNEKVDLGVKWSTFDLTPFKSTPIDMPSSLTNAGARSGAGAIKEGLPSDIKYSTNQLAIARKKIADKLAGPNADAYSKSAEFVADSNEVNVWAEKLALLKSREDNYTKNKTRLQKSTVDDYAIFGGKALVQDITNNGSPTIVSVNDLITARVQNSKGQIMPKYVPVSIGTALDLRYEDENFSGFTRAGSMLDGILEGALDTDAIDKSMTDLFSRVGSVNEEKGTFIYPTGETKPLTEVIADIVKSKQIYTTGTTKTNQPNLEAAMSVFTRGLNAAQFEALRGRAVYRFLSQHGNKQVDPAKADEMINAMVYEDIASRALVYLNKADKSKTSASGGSGGSGGDKDPLASKEIAMNYIDYKIMTSSGEKLQLEAKNFKDAYGLENFVDNVMVEADSTSLNLQDGYTEGAKDQKKGTGYLLANNTFIRKLTGDNLRGNLFLPDKNSTPVAELMDKDGLNRASINVTSYGGAAKVIRDIPYTEKDGVKKVAWDELARTIQWGKKYKEFTEARMREIATNKLKQEGKELTEENIKEAMPPYLSRDERAVIIQKTKDLLKYDITNSPEVKVGNMIMIPIVVVDKGRNINSADLSSMMQGGISSEEQELVEGTGVELDRHIKRTYACTIVTNDMRRDAYGPSMEIKDKVNVLDLLQQAKTAQRLSREGFDFMDVLIQNSTVNPAAKEDK